MFQELRLRSVPVRTRMLHNHATRQLYIRNPVNRAMYARALPTAMTFPRAQAIRIHQAVRNNFGYSNLNNCENGNSPSQTFNQRKNEPAHEIMVLIA